MTTDQGHMIQTSALLSVTVSNVRSYRDEAHLSLLSGQRGRSDVAHDVRWGAGQRTTAVLPSAGIYGANASGKSTILWGLADMRELVLGSFRRGTPSSTMPRRPFRLDATSRLRPSGFEIDVVIDGVRWQYGFEVDDHEVIAEYAYHYPNGRQAKVFERDQENIRFGPSFRAENRVLRPLLRPNALIVSAAGALQQSALHPLYHWFQSNLAVAASAKRSRRALRTADLAQSDELRSQVLALIKAADLGITDIAREPIPEELHEQLKRLLLGDDEDLDDEQVELFVEDRLRLTHCGAQGCTEFDMEEESLGTLVWIGLIGPVLDALAAGTVLLADELDASLHPHLVDQLLAMFQDPATNPRCAQLVFNAHDTTVLGDSELRRLGRDQIWFTEKDLDGVTSIYPLSDLHPRKDEALQRRYLQGRFGGVPVLDKGSFIAAAPSQG